MVTTATLLFNVTQATFSYSFLQGNGTNNMSTEPSVTEPDAPYTLAESIVIGTILSLFIILAVAGNVLVCVAVFTDRRLKHLNNLLLVSLAIADLLMALMVMSFAVVNDILNKWIFGPVFCNIWISSDVTCSTASILNLCVISLDRYIHIRDPFKYEQWMNWKKLAAMISAVWILSLTLSFVPIHMQWHRNAEDRGKELAEFECMIDFNPVYSVVSSTISFYIPCIVMLSIYLQLYCYARRHIKEIKRTSAPSHFQNGGKGSNSGSNDHKAAVTLGIIVGVFLFCWMPFFIINLVEAFCKCVPPVIFKILTWLGYVNSCLNPIIYSIFNKDFRNAFRRILFPKSCKCVKSHRNGYISTRTTTKTKSEYIMHTFENGNKKDCKEPLCAEITPL